jgi:DNA-binding response OmpR family regulator/signal transduction histidine kinase
MPDLPLRRALHYGETVRAEEVIMEFPDQHMVPTLVNSTPVYAEDGRIVSAILMIQDTTPLQELENLRNEFLGIVTHELRTPLSTIKGAAATALRSRGSLRPGESQEFFQIIDQQADHLTDIANNLLDVTKIEANALELDVEPTDLTSVLEEAVANHRRANNNLIEIRVPENLPLVNVDCHRINQVLVNLLAFAARFSPPESPIIVEADCPENCSVTVRVQHSGQATHNERLPYLFQKFGPIDDNNGVNHWGLGIGLAICRGIVESHGGRIWATNNGRTAGTTISFTLPKVVEEQSSTLDVSLPRGVIAGGNRAPNIGSRILAVDDDENALRFLCRLLEGAGYQALRCIKPAEVPEIIESQEPDLVLLDVMFPKINGLDLMKSIREYSDVPIMFLTARDARDEMITALKAGADDYLSKPYSEAELLARVEVILRRHSGIGLPGTTSRYEFDGLIIDFDQRRVTVNGSESWLTATEFKLISALARHPGRVLTHDQILQLVWGRDYSGETELVRSMVRRLRRKLGEDTQNPRYIFTVARVGYRIASPHLLP